VTAQSTDNQGVGVVEAHSVEIALPAEGLLLECGRALKDLCVAYESYGELSEAKDNVIFVCHALTGDAHAAGRHHADDKSPGWWDDMIGPGRGLDTNRYFVVCANILGGCKGTTGPGSTDPDTGKAYGSTFPEITVGDIVDVHRLLLLHLGITSLRAVIGGSMGGMQALEWGIRYGEMVERCVCIASTMRLSAQALAFDIVGRNAIESDPDWQGGDYYDSAQRPGPGLAQARMIGHITYLSPEVMTSKFGRERREDDSRFQVESYLEYQGNKFVDRFDANSYLRITNAMDSYDVEEQYGTVEAAMNQVKSRFLVVALSSDWLFPPEQSIELSTALLKGGRRISYCILQAPYGHDAFLVDIEHLADVVSTFLGADSEDNDSAASPHVPSDSEAENHEFIAGFIAPGSRVIDLGCGDGALIHHLVREHGVDALGVDIDLKNIINVVERGRKAIQCDVDEGLAMVADQAYDYAILSQTLQVVHRPRHVLREMLRVAKEGIVTFPNFGRWSHRLYLGVMGRMPISKSLPFEWHNTPNIHLATLKDFVELCRQEGIDILDIECTADNAIGRLLLGIGLRNLGADRIFVRISRGNHESHD